MVRLFVHFHKDTANGQEQALRNTRFVPASHKLPCPTKVAHGMRTSTLVTEFACQVWRSFHLSESGLGGGIQPSPGTVAVVPSVVKLGEVFSPSESRARASGIKRCQVPSRGVWQEVFSRQVRVEVEASVSSLGKFSRGRGRARRRFRVWQGWRSFFRPGESRGRARGIKRCRVPASWGLRQCFRVCGQALRSFHPASRG